MMNKAVTRVDANGVTHVDQNKCVIPDLSVKDLLSVIP
jgi:ABC-type branched-subunit amino acid transport system ATPase component